MTNRLSAPPARVASNATSSSATLLIGYAVNAMPSESAPRRANVSSASKCCGLKIAATRRVSGATSLSSSIRFAAISSVRNVSPVKFVAGRASDAAIPARIGLSLMPATIGIAPWLASNNALATSPPTASSRSGFCATSSAANSGSRAAMPSAWRWTISMLRPSINPRWTSASFNDWSIGPSVAPPKTSHPIRTARRCAAAGLSGMAAAAPPRTAMNSRRRIRSPRTRAAPPDRLSLPQCRCQGRCGFNHEAADASRRLGFDPSGPLPASVLALPVLALDVLDRDDAGAVGLEHRHALRAAPDDADVVDRHADGLALVGDQHDLVGVLDREGGHELAVALVHRHGDDAFAAASRDPVLVGRGALAVALLGDREHELLGLVHMGVFVPELDLPGHRLLRLRALHAIRRRLVRRLDSEGATHRRGASQERHPLLRRRVDMAQDRHRDEAVALAERNAAHARRVAALEHAHIGNGEADALALRRREQHVVGLRADLHVDDLVALVELHRDLAGAVDLHEVRQLVAADAAGPCREHHVAPVPGGLVLGQRHDRRDPLALLERQHAAQEPALGVRRRERQAPDLLLVDLAE